MAGHGTAGSGRMQSGWPHNHGSYLPRGGLCDAGEPGTRQGPVQAARRADRGPVIPLSTSGDRCGAGLVRRDRRARPRRGTASRTAIRHRKSRAPAGGRAGPARDQTVNQVSARRAGPVTRLPPARPRPAAMCHPVAVVRMAGMIIVVVPADPAACPALPRQASIERRIAEYGRLAAPGRPRRPSAHIVRFC